jgi:hypothetical protein
VPLTFPAGAKLPGRPGTTPGPVLVFLEGVRDFVWDGIAMTRSRGMAVLGLNCSNVTLHAVNATGLSGQAAVVEGCEKRLFLAPFSILKRSFYQDRLGTNIGKVEKKVFCVGVRM